MKHSAVALLLVAAVLTACQTPQSGVVSQPGHGAIAIAVEPNPIVATNVSGDTYDFPFDLVVRETGGRPVTIQRATATVFAPGGIKIAEESWDAQRINATGYATALSPNGELRYHFAPRKSVPDDRLFGGVSAELRVDGVDDTGTPTSAQTVVSVTRR